MEVEVILDEVEECAIAQNYRDIDDKEGDGDPRMSCFQSWEASQQKRGSTDIGPHSVHTTQLKAQLLFFGDCLSFFLHANVSWQPQSQYSQPAINA